MIVGWQGNEQRGTAVARLVALALGLMVLSGCATFEYHETRNVAASRLDDETNLEISEEQLLDVGIVVFDPGMDLLDDDQIAFANVRQSEAVWFSSQLKTMLQNSNIWGQVRTMPSANSVMDVLINGEILESNGEFVKFRVTVQDATGREWFTKEYEQQASSYAYNPEVNYNRDPFRASFVEVANDLFDYRVALSESELVNIRNVSKIRFAHEFVPAAFSDFLQEDEGQYSLLRVPAANDPMMRRIDRVRARNDLFLDVIQDYYRVFNSNMAHPYQEWRKASYKEVVYARQLRTQSRNEKIAGVASILVGVLAQTSSNVYTRGAGHIGIFSGADLIYNGYVKQNEALLHSATVRELGAALETELEPSVIDLEDRSVTLSGTVDDQYQEWRRILGEMFEAESGLAPNKKESSEDQQSVDDNSTAGLFDGND
jgi:hypothetical protein